MGKIVNVGDYRLGYDQGYLDGKNDGYVEGHEAAMKKYTALSLRLTAELCELEARIAVLDKKIG